MNLLRRWLLLPVLGAAALTLVACSGDEDSPTATATATATSGAAVAAATSTPEPADAFMAQSPADLQSYRYRVNVTVAAEALEDAEGAAELGLDGDLTLALEGEVVNPDRERTSTAIDIGFLTLQTETIRIGDQEWSRSGQEPWTPSTPGEGEELLDADFSPGSLFTSEAEFDYEALTERLEEHGWTDEEVNGVPARRFTFTQEEFYRVFEADDAVIPADVDATFTADVWLADELGVPVKMLVVGVDGAGTEILRLEMDVVDINADIVIEPPV